MAETGSFKYLLLATDGSPFSEGAESEAIQLAKQCGGRLTALIVVEFNPEYEALAPEAVHKAEADAKGMVDAIRDRAQNEGITCEPLVVRGVHPYEKIVDQAAKLKADAIVMGRRGRTGLKKLLMGSVTERVIGHSPVKVLVVPRGA